LDVTEHTHQYAGLHKTSFSELYSSTMLLHRYLFIDSAICEWSEVTRPRWRRCRAVWFDSRRVFSCDSGTGRRVSLLTTLAK